MDCQPYVVSTEILDGDVLVRFEDGRFAIYSASLLHARFSEAEELDEASLEEQ